MSDSGSEMPARLHFVSYGNGSYIFKDKEVAGDGSYYGTSIRKFCEGISGRSAETDGYRGGT